MGDDKTKGLVFTELGKAVIEAWERFGFSWSDMVEGFGAGAGGIGMPPQDDFYQLARNAVDIELKDQPETELRRLMRSRLYRRYRNFDWHYDFTHGNPDNIDRYELIGVAVWSHLYQEMEWQYEKLDTEMDDEDEEVMPQQLHLEI